MDDFLQANHFDLEAGRKHHWDAKDDRTRLCTIIHGKLCVRIGGSEIVIRDRGLFKIPPNLACEVQNVGSSEAALTVITALEPGAIAWEPESEDES